MTKLMTKCLVLFLLCTSMQVFAGKEKRHEEYKVRIANKILFVSECAREDIEFRCINQQYYKPKLCGEYGVTGCGEKSIYTRIGTSWIQTYTENISMGTASQNAANIESAKSTTTANIATSNAASMSATNAANAASTAAASAAAASAAAASAAAASAAAASATAAKPPM